jgi:hypothetical protein
VKNILLNAGEEQLAICLVWHTLKPPAAAAASLHVQVILTAGDQPLSTSCSTACSMSPGLWSRAGCTFHLLLSDDHGTCFTTPTAAGILLVAVYVLLKVDLPASAKHYVYGEHRGRLIAPGVPAVVSAASHHCVRLSGMQQQEHTVLGVCTDARCSWVSAHALAVCSSACTTWAALLPVLCLCF